MSVQCGAVLGIVVMHLAVLGFAVRGSRVAEGVSLIFCAVLMFLGIVTGDPVGAALLAACAALYLVSWGMDWTLHDLREVVE